MLKILTAAIMLLNAITTNCVFGVAGEENAAGIPVIYSTDLFHPHADPDDHFDAACLFALPELDIKVVVLDQRKGKVPGFIPLSQLNHITGRNVPWAVGLAGNLTTHDDKALSQPEECQGGIKAILKTLKESSSPVTIITVGSLRDVAAAMNRAPKLFEQKVGKLFVFAGEASNPASRESNVAQDLKAYIRVMNSGLPIYWVPCYDGGVFHNDGNASWWRCDQIVLLKYARPKTINFFIYALLRKTDKDYLQFIDDDVNLNDKKKVLTGDYRKRHGREKRNSTYRDLWCTALFTHIAGRKIVAHSRGEFMAVPANAKGKGIDLFNFAEVSLYIDDQGVPQYNSSLAHEMKRFRMLRRDLYSYAMTSVTAHLLGQLDSPQNPPTNPSK